MRGLRRFFVTSLLGMVLIAGFIAGPAAAEQPSGRDARLAELRAALADLNQGNDLAFELGRIEMWAPMTGFARAYGNVIEISPIALDLFQDRAGARAMAAFLAAYVGTPRPARYDGRGPGVAEAVAAVGAIAAGSAIDSDNSRNWNAFDWHDNRRGAVERGDLRGARMLVMLEKAQGCSGPLVAMLARASAAKARDAATSDLVWLARQASRDLGTSVYPPDDRCAAGA